MSLWTVFPQINSFCLQILPQKLVIWWLIYEDYGNKKLWWSHKGHVDINAHDRVHLRGCACALVRVRECVCVSVCVNQGKGTEDKSSTLQQQQWPITVRVRTCCTRIPGNQRLLYKSNYLPLTLNISIQTAPCICCSMLQICCYYLFRLGVFSASWWLVIFFSVSIETQSVVSQWLRQ